MNIFKNYLIEEFTEDYQEGYLTRREALKLLAAVTGSLVVANSILAGCSAPTEPVSTLASSIVSTQTVSATQAAIAASPTATSGSASTNAPAESSNVPTKGAALSGEDVQFPGEGATLLGHLAQPTGDGRYPIVLVCHENRGLTEHIKDVTRRLANAGYVALAVDLLSRDGGSSSLAQDQVPGVLSNTDTGQFVLDFRSGWDYLKTLPNVEADRLGMVGFCFGGGVTWLIATQMPELRAAVPFYGPHPPVEAVPGIQAAVLAIYAGNDQRINQGVPVIEKAMQENHKIYEKVIYPGTDHAFHNDTSPRYNREAAMDAWKRTLDWFATYL